MPTTCLPQVNQRRPPCFWHMQEGAGRSGALGPSHTATEGTRPVLHALIEIQEAVTWLKCSSAGLCSVCE